AREARVQHLEQLLAVPQIHKGEARAGDRRDPRACAKMHRGFRGKGKGRLHAKVATDDPIYSCPVFPPRHLARRRSPRPRRATRRQGVRGLRVHGSRPLLRLQHPR
ncbi:hypothetical protein GW17_00006903, partial [Ensete ventricosum]